MNKFGFRTLEFAYNTETPAKIYQSEIGPNGTKITAGSLPSLEITAKMDDFVDVIVCHIENPAKFYVHLKENKVDDMKRHMSGLYAGPAATKSLNNPNRGQFCAIKNTDGSWYRGVIIERVSPTQIQVYLLDYGTEIKTSIGQVKELHPECRGLPPQAIECKLENVGDDTSLVGKFRDIALNQVMAIRIMGQDAVALLVILYKIIGDSDVNINDYLLGKEQKPLPLPSAAVNSQIGSSNQPNTNAMQQTMPNYAQGGQTFGRGGGMDARRNGRGNFNNESRGTDFGNRPYEYSGSSAGDRNFHGGVRGGRGGYGSGFGDKNNNAEGRCDGFGGGSLDGDKKTSFSSDRGNGGGGRFGGFNRGGGTQTTAFTNAGQGESFPSYKPYPDTGQIPATSVHEFRKSKWQINGTFRGKIIQAKSPLDFCITTAQFSGFSALPDEMWQYSKQGSGFVPLNDCHVGQSCLLYAEPPPPNYPIFCRGIIKNVNGQGCDVFLVDYAETKYSHAKEKLFEVPGKFTALDRQAIKCTLFHANEFRAGFNDETRRKQFVDMVSGQDAFATVKAFDRDGSVVVIVEVGVEKRDMREICNGIVGRGAPAYGNY